MQGDMHRAKVKDREKLRDRPTFSQILSGVDDMQINDGYQDTYNIKYYDDGNVSNIMS